MAAAARADGVCRRKILSQISLCMHPARVWGVRGNHFARTGQPWDKPGHDEPKPSERALDPFLTSRRDPPASFPSSEISVREYFDRPVSLSLLDVGRVRSLLRLTAI